jgi:hypothetical protein
MSKEVMHRVAGDNEYLHRDFHGALSTGIQYIEETFGDEAVRSYLRRFAVSYYAPLTVDLRRRGLVALEDHYRQVYDREGGSVQFRCSEDELIIDVDACPAVTHMRKQGYPVARLFRETIATVGSAICEGTDFESELITYDEPTGRCRQRFFRRAT